MLKVFTLYIGAGTEDEITTMLGRHFESFTVQAGTGVFRGKRERTWVVTLAAADAAAVIGAAEELRRQYRQEGVGIAFANRYFRVTAEDAASELARWQSYLERFEP